MRFLALFLISWLAHLGHASHEIYTELQSASRDVVEGEYRTGYHFQPLKHWINDPNGPLYYKGLYHLFYQYNPKGAVWGNIVWAHSVSKDLINWIGLKPAIFPTKSFDINGCWSGSATILPGDRPAILYTGIDPDNRQVQNIAFPKNLSDPYLRDWVKPEYNPVISPSGLNASAFRDPTTAWYSSGHWRVAVGSKNGTRGMAVLYRSKDFVHWTKAKHPLHSVEGTGMWECPDFYPVAAGAGGMDTSEKGAIIKHVLKVSLDNTRYEYYTIGKYDEERDLYLPDNSSTDDHMGLRYDYGNFYASKTFYDPKKDRRILWGWSNESDSVGDDMRKGWAGIQAIPRTVSLDCSGRQLVYWPVEELNALRGKYVHIGHKKIGGGEVYHVEGIQSSQADVDMSFKLRSLEKAEPFDPSWVDPQALCAIKGADVKGGVGPFGLHVLASNNLEERTSVFFRIFKAETKHVVLMCHDPTSSSLRPKVYTPTFAGFVDVDIAQDHKISLRSLIDVSVVESFGAKGKTCITSRVYPTLAKGKDAHLYVFNNGEEEVKINRLTAWELRRPLMNEKVVD